VGGCEDQRVRKEAGRMGCSNFFWVIFEGDEGSWGEMQQLLGRERGKKN
jgi:hypothetical protein